MSPPHFDNRPFDRRPQRRCYGVDTTRKSYLPRLTGEVPPKGAEGQGPTGDLLNFRSEICRYSTGAFPLRPRGPPPRMTGEANEMTICPPRISGGDRKPSRPARWPG